MENPTTIDCIEYYQNLKTFARRFQSVSTPVIWDYKPTLEEPTAMLLTRQRSAEHSRQILEFQEIFRYFVNQNIQDGDWILLFQVLKTTNWWITSLVSPYQVMWKCEVINNITHLLIALLDFP